MEAAHNWRCIIPTISFYLDRARSSIMAADCPFLWRYVLISWEDLHVPLSLFFFEGGGWQLVSYVVLTPLQSKRSFENSSGMQLNSRFSFYTVGKQNRHKFSLMHWVLMLEHTYELLSKLSVLIFYTCEIKVKFYFAGTQYYERRQYFCVCDIRQKVVKSFSTEKSSKNK